MPTSPGCCAGAQQGCPLPPALLASATSLQPTPPFSPKTREVVCRNTLRTAEWHNGKMLKRKRKCFILTETNGSDERALWGWGRAGQGLCLEREGISRVPAGNPGGPTLRLSRVCAPVLSPGSGVAGLRWGLSADRGSWEGEKPHDSAFSPGCPGFREAFRKL